MNGIRTEIVLDAPAERIWELVTDCELYSRWNPLFVKGTGSMQTGAQLELVVQLPGMGPFIVTPTVLVAEPRSGFRWQHTVVGKGLFRWRYGIDLEVDAPNRLKVVQQSAFGGILGPVFNLAFKKEVANGLKAMNDAVRRWGEKGHIQCLRC